MRGSLQAGIQMESVAGMRLSVAVTMTNHKKYLSQRLRTMRSSVMAKEALDHEMAAAVSPVAAFWYL